MRAQIASADGQTKTLIYSTPSPTNRNVKAAKANLEELEERLGQTYKALRKGAQLNTNEDGVSVVSSILRYISDYKKRVDNHIDANSELTPIEVPNQCAFGFEKYFRTTLIPEGEVVPRLDKQRQILSYILDQLIDADPTAIREVNREDLEDVSGDKGFQIDPVISARVPDVIDTFAFQVTFTGYTPVLRRFLNNLAKFQLPVVVRSVSVDRINSKSQADASEIFNPVNTIVNGDEKTPIISETESLFVVTLEFIEVVTAPKPE